MKIKFWAGLTLIFILGLLAGTLIAGVYYKHKIERFSKFDHNARKHLLMKRLVRELDLNNEQREEIGKIFEQYQGKMDDVRAVFLPEVRKLSMQMIKDMERQLDGEQRKRMEQIARKIKLLGRHRRGRPFIILPSPQQLFPEIKGRLHLTDRQQAEFNTIIRETYGDMEKALKKYSYKDPLDRLEIRREMREFRRSRDYRLSRVLSEEQMGIYKEIEAEIRRQMRYAPGPATWREGLK